MIWVILIIAVVLIICFIKKKSKKETGTNEVSQPDVASKVVLAEEDEKVLKEIEWFADSFCVLAAGNRDDFAGLATVEVVPVSGQGILEIVGKAQLFWINKSTASSWFKKNSLEVSEKYKSSMFMEDGQLDRSVQHKSFEDMNQRLQKLSKNNQFAFHMIYLDYMNSEINDQSVKFSGKLAQYNVSSRQDVDATVEKNQQLFTSCCDRIQQRFPFVEVRSLNNSIMLKYKSE